MSKENGRRTFLGTAAACIVAAKASLTEAAQASFWEARMMPSLDGATGWLNSPPLTAAGLRGKVVLVEFSTYSCINWLRTLPYVRAWAEKYKDQGLVVIGVHTPEFEFEKNIDNVRWAMKDMRIDYPIAIDSDYAIWRAFRNNSWPAFYFVDAQGTIRHQRNGEGEYDLSERAIQKLLSEAGASGIGRELVSVEARGLEAAADWGNLRSPENYVGYERTQGFSSPGGVLRDKGRAYTAPARLMLNHWALSGDWTVGKQATALNRAGRRIACRSRRRYRRAGKRQGNRAAAVPAHPATEAHRRPTVRDRVSRSWRGGLLVHLRLIPGFVLRQTAARISRRATWLVSFWVRRRR